MHFTFYTSAVFFITLISAVAMVITYSCTKAIHRPRVVITEAVARELKAAIARAKSD
jgi:hypothetical protein